MKTKPILIFGATLAISAATVVQPERGFTFDRDAVLRGDFDRDGVPNSKDPCWFSRAGARTRVPGCTRLDVGQLPDALAGRLPGAMEDAIGYLEDDREVREIAEAIRSLARAEKEAVTRIRSGNLCGGAPDYAVLETQLESIAGMFDPLLRTAAAAITEPGDRQGDVRAVEQRVSELTFLESMVAMAAEASRELGGVVQEVCAASSPGLMTRGVVEAVDDSTRRVILRDGRTFAWTPEAELGHFSAGQRIAIQATDLGDATGIATRITPEITFPAETPNLLPCLRLTVAPIQPFPPISNGPFVQHDLVAYEYGSFFPGISQVIRLEEGMRLGARSVCPDKGSPVLGFTRHSMAVHISYVADSNESKATWLAENLTAFSTPVALPTDVDPSFPAVLTVVNNVQQCRLLFLQDLDCGPKKKTFTFIHDLHVVDRGSMCQAFYEDTRFNVDDRVPGQFLPARVSNIFSLAVGDGGTPPSFVAQGYMYAPPPAGSSYPFVFAINNQAQFAIHSHDFYPIHGADNFSEALTLRAATGVDRAAGLMWPRAVGIRNGRGYQYSCHLPNIVRDVVGFCPTKAVDAYYHMPFAMGVTTWVQSQGNLSDPGCIGDNCPTHANEYAYDMTAPCNSEIRAARGGRVIWVREDQQAQAEKFCCGGQPCVGCAPICCTIQGASCPHNELWIKHQDDSIGRYVHMPKDGVFVNQNDVVRRGQLVALVGSTGNSSAPHLHFEERGTVSTHLALFVAQNPETSGVLTCYEPLKDQALRSFNKECTTCPPQ